MKARMRLALGIKHGIVEGGFRWIAAKPGMTSPKFATVDQLAAPRALVVALPLAASLWVFGLALLHFG